MDSVSGNPIVTFKETEVMVFLGDITGLEVDAVVNAANSQLWMGAGVAGAIKRAGGQEIEEEAVRLGPIPVGESVVTKAGKLKARYVIHAAAMGPDLVTDEIKIRRATETALLRARERNLASIALPALGTGVGGFPLDECARVMISEVRQQAREKTSLEKVVLVRCNPSAAEVFQRQLNELKR